MSETLDAPQTDTPTPEAVAPEDDLRAAIGAAFDEVAGKADADAEPDAEPEARTQERDERGRFVGQARDAEPEAEAGEQEKAEDEVQAEAAPPPRPEVPPELAPVKQVLDEYSHLYAPAGVAPDAAVRALFAAQKALQERPYEAIQSLARSFGVDLTKFAPQQQAAQPQPQAQTNDPAVNVALERLARLEQTFQAQQQQAEQQQQQAAAAARAQIEGAIAEFAADPKHTHFPAVRHLMGGLMQAGAANDLATAYEMACRAHPEVSKAIAKAETEAREKAAAAERAKAAAQAKAKAVSVRGSPPINGTPRAPESLRGLIEAAWDGRLN